MEYWSAFGDVSSFTYDYEDLFDSSVDRGAFDRIIVQDTLHHLEPLPEALAILRNHLRDDGKLLAIEENGNNLVQSLKLYRQRGNKRIIEFYDERLNKTILLGNENIRSLATWKREMAAQGLSVEEDSVQYVRAYPPSLFNKMGYERSIASEQRLWKNQALLREYFFFGINFMAGLSTSESKPMASSGQSYHTA
jgi:SAM-dependent methyltransferase